MAHIFLEFVKLTLTYTNGAKFLLSTASRGSADLAILYLSQPKSGFCGLAFVDAARFGKNSAFGWVGKGCQDTTLGHELGHIFGAKHNKEIVDKPPTDGKAYGKLITGSNFYSIMA